MYNPPTRALTATSIKGPNLFCQLIYTFYTNNVEAPEFGPIIPQPNLQYTVILPPNQVNGTLWNALVACRDSITQDVITTTTGSITIGRGFAQSNSFIIQTLNLDGTVTLTLVPLPGTLTQNIFWAYNYELLKPSNPLQFTVNKNGIYEVSFLSGSELFAYYGITEVTQADPTVYIKIISDDNNLYGTFGTPISVNTLRFEAVGTCASSYKIFVGGKYYSNSPTLNLANIPPLTLIYAYITDTCGIVLSANTYILPPGPLPVPRPITGRPKPLLPAPLPSAEIFNCC